MSARGGTKGIDLQAELKRGDTYAGFEILDVIFFDELKATGIHARHVRTGASLFHLLNDDEENLFSFAFATPPADSTGVAHILEHSVLCGSVNHPLKDAFLVLAQGSLQTFLNAMTFPDKTIYPASSTNETDYFNLMGVYGDAVFRPLLEEWTFLQEGRRYEINAEGRLDLTGVVYNEMKGNYSSMDSIAADWSYRSVLPGTPYAHDSGGDPDDIPKLDWEGLKRFHANAYSPANCRIFLCGNISTERQMAFLDKRFLSQLESGHALPAPQKAERWTEPRRIQVPCPLSGDSKSTVLLSWLCGDSADGNETLALAALTEILLGHDGSPLARALVESHLGEDLAPASGLEGELRETVFAVGLRGVDSEAAAKVEKLVLDVLGRLATDGIATDDIDAALKSLEFSNREIRRSGGPFSLSWLRRSLRAWLHGGTPWDTLLFEPRLAYIKDNLASDPRYFESLIKRYFLDNPHRALVSIDPQEGYSERKEAELRASLDAHGKAMDEAARTDLKASSDELARIQALADTPEALATIPHISRKDLSREVETIPREVGAAGTIPTLSHDLFTNGIAYVDFAFPVDILDPEDYLWLPLLSRVLVSTGLPGLDWGQVSSLLARTTGAFYSMLQSGSLAPGGVRSRETPAGILELGGRDWLVFRLKALEAQLPAALDLVKRLLVEADLGDLTRLEDLVREFRNDLDSSLAPGGHSFAASRAGRRFSRSRAIDELWGGISQLEFMHKLAEGNVSSLASALVRIRDRLVSHSGLLVNITGSGAALATTRGIIASSFSDFGAPRPRSAKAAESSDFFELVDTGDRGDEAWSSASLQVGFGALALPAAPFAGREQAAELVLAHRLSTGALWEEIRMKGGAYGAFAHPDGLEPLFTLATYRDPAPARSLDAFTSALLSASKERIEDDDLEKAIIGTYSKEVRPRSPSEKGLSDFMRYLYGIEPLARRTKLEAIVDMTADAVADAARRLHEAKRDGYIAVLAGKTEAGKAAAALGAPVRTLPL